MTENRDQSALAKVHDAGEGVRIIEFDRKEKANTFSEEMLRQIAGALSDAQHDPTVRAVVATGGDKVFAAGGDLKEWEDKTPLDLWGSKRNEYWRIFNEFPKPLIAAVNGYAYGGGCEFVLQSDIAICGENARFCLPEISLGFVPGRGGTQRLPVLAGRGAASLMILTGDPIPAGRALELGIVVEVCPDANTLGRAVEIARRIAMHPTLQHLSLCGGNLGLHHLDLRPAVRPAVPRDRPSGTRRRPDVQHERRAFGQSRPTGCHYCCMGRRSHLCGGRGADDRSIDPGEQDLLNKGLRGRSTLPDARIDHRSVKP